MACEIPLTKRQVALVDEEDFEKLRGFRWFANWNRHTKSYRALRFEKIPGQKRRRGILMHREIMGLEFGNRLQVDHLDHNTLDNRKRNLRVVTNRENNENRRHHSRDGVGVYFDPGSRRRPFRAQAVLDGKRMSAIGLFETAAEAQAARDVAVRKADAR